MRRRSALLICALLSLSFCAVAEDCGEALKPGVDLYKQGHYAEAVVRFESAAVLHSFCENAWLYLATANVQQYIPGADVPENVHFAEEAIRGYGKVLELNPKNIGSMKGIAYLLLQMKRFEDAKQYYQKAANDDPTDPELPYSIGVIDWTMAYQPRMEERAKLDLKPTDPLKDIAICDMLRSRSSAIIDDGIEQFRRAVNLRPDYDDAMAYMNLMYREKADLECESPKRREKYLKIADDWVDRTLDIKRRKAEQQKPCDSNFPGASPCFPTTDSK